jgi:hypothetical protein
LGLSWILRFLRMREEKRGEERRREEKRGEEFHDRFIYML